MSLFWRKTQRENDIERELRAHLDLETEEQREAGLSPQDAHYRAQRALGNSALIQESVREVWNWNWLESLAQDFRYSFRSLRASPVFAVVAISSLGLAIGANTAIFSFVDALLLKHLPVPEAAQLVEFSEYSRGEQVNTVFHFPLIDALDKEKSTFDGVFGRFLVRVSVLTDGFAEPLGAELVTGAYFRTLQVKPALGRLLTEAEIDAGSGNPVCVISYSTWQQLFGGDPNIIGRKLSLNVHAYQIIGVTEKGFNGSELQSRIAMQIPVSRMGDFMGGFYTIGSAGQIWKSKDFQWLEPLARLKPGVSAAHALTVIESIARSNAQNRPQTAKTTFRLTGGSQGANYASRYAEPLTILMSIVALVLLIACANLAGLLLARANFRAKEFAVRLSLGASRWRVVRQLMVESLTIAGCGGLVGFLLALWIVHTLLAYLNAGRPDNSLLQAVPDPLVIGFSISLSLLTAVLFGLVPSWQSARPDTVTELKGPSANSHATGLAMRKFLIVFQIALSVVILFGAGLLTRTLSKLRTIDLGFDPARVISLNVDPEMNGHRPDETDRIFDDILNRLRAQPGIRAAGLTLVSPLSGAMISLNLSVPGHVKQTSERQPNFNMTGPGYFSTLNQPLLAGRDFTTHDRRNAPDVAIVNQFFVAQYMPGQNPIGRHIKAADSDAEIVGLVKDARYLTLRESPSPIVYLPVAQTKSSGYTLLVRTDLPRRQAIAQIQSVIHSIDPKLPVTRIQELQEQIDQTISSERVLSFLSALFSVLATLLCSLGIYGLIAYAVSRRTREIGIRFAIGAQKSDVARLFLRESVILVLLGVAAGIPLALLATRALKSILYGVAATDVSALALTIAIFLATGLLASLLPVLKAARIQPLEALRYE